MRKTLLFSVLVAVVGCGGAASGPATGDESEVVAAEATVRLGPDFTLAVEGEPSVGKPLVVEYALERLPQCRGNVGGGGPGWNVAGYYSENGGPPKVFEVSALSADGKDRVAKPAQITPTQGGDLALWFQVTNRWGCSEYDSAFGQNFHLDVAGPPPSTEATITFDAQGTPRQEGALRAGGKVKIRYEQDRLPGCRRTQAGYPQWTITGFAALGGDEAQTFATGRPDGADREEIDAVLPLPRAGELALWFQVSSLGGCNAYDSNGGANYTFVVE